MLATAAALAALAVADPPSGTDVAAISNVAWGDAAWADDATGQMPLGNGDVTASVWVSNATGDLRILVGKSDAFDENSQPVRVGALRVTFDPPLWDPSPAPPPPPPPSDPDAIARFVAHPGLIGLQTAQLRTPPGFKCSSAASCPNESAVLCDTVHGCQGFSLNSQVSSWTLSPELFSVAPPDPKKPGPGWTHWQRVRPAPPSPPTPSWNGIFQASLDLPTATVTVRSKYLTVQVYVNATSPVVKITAQPSGLSSALTAAGFSARVALEPYRVHRKTPLGRGFCFPRFEQPDTVVATNPLSKPAVVWYHWNGQHGNATYFNDTMAGQGMPLGRVDLPDMFFLRAFGGAVVGTGLTRDASDPTVLSGESLTSLDVTAVLHTDQVDDPPAWTTGLTDAVTRALATPTATSRAAHEAEWASLWDRSYVVASSKGTDGDAAAQVTDHCNWDRFLNVIQGRTAFAPIKFNGQAFTTNNTGQGWDYRGWGADYWWQNTRQPYYNSLTQGDVDVLHSMFDFYLRMLPYVEERTKVQFGNTSTPITAGALYEETCTQFGLYNEGDWGCGSPSRKYGASENTFIRFHFTGSLELSLMILDDFTFNGDAAALARYLPIPAAVVEAYRQRFPNRDKSGKIDMWPAQALETWQCPDPTSRTACPTNPSTDIAGLQAVLTRLIALPPSSTTPQQVASWKAHLEALPPVPVAEGKIQPAGTYSGRPHNSENTQLYPVHPFRVYMQGKPGLDVAQETYRQRPHPCNDGWCQDVIDAAMLNLTDEAWSQVAARAAAAPAKGFRFGGFAQHYQDYEPSLDHWAFMRTAVNYMLVSPVEDAAQSVLLFPTWPTDQVDVAFKLHAPLGTTIEASCKGGRLEYLNVDPPSRKADVRVLNCEA